MTRGRKPIKALTEAEQIARKRGAVQVIPCARTNPFDLIIFEPHRNVFVKVKRSQTSFVYALEILHHYQRDIASLHRVALTSVTAREFWVRSPNGTWQFFLIRHDSVLEIRADGLYVPCESLPMRTVDLSSTPADGTDDPVSPSEDRE